VVPIAIGRELRQEPSYLDPGGSEGDPDLTIIAVEKFLKSQ
jgi:hypothetical protein